MNFKFLSTGSAFTIDNYHTNFLIERNDKHLLIDAGLDWNLYEEEEIIHIRI